MMTIDYVARRMAMDSTEISGVKSEIALNRQTLGTICKNLMEVTATSRTFNGVTFTINPDGSITVNGTATERADFNICQSVEYHSGQILTGCPKNGSAETYCLAIYTAGRDTGEGLVLSSDGAHECYIRIEKGYTANNLVFFPMLRDGNIADDTFEPYRPNLQTSLAGKADNDFFLSGATLLESGTDLNSLISAGSYYSPNNTASLSMFNIPDYTKHEPVTGMGGFRLDVVYRTGTGQFYQILYPNWGKPVLYLRSFESNQGFHDWQGIPLESVGTINTNTQ